MSSSYIEMNFMDEVIRVFITRKGGGYGTIKSQCVEGIEKSFEDIPEFQISLKTTKLTVNCFLLQRIMMPLCKLLLKSRHGFLV